MEKQITFNDQEISTAVSEHFWTEIREALGFPLTKEDCGVTVSLHAQNNIFTATVTRMKDH